jgi:hypothetical protein
LRSGRDVAAFGKFRPVRARQRAEHHVQCVHRRVQARLERRDGSLNLRERALGLPDLKLGRQPFAVQQVDGGQQFLLRLHLVTGHFQASLQATDSDVDIGSLCRYGQPCGHRAGFGGLVLGKCRFAATAQAAEDVQLPARADISSVTVAIAVEPGSGIQDLAQGRFDRLVRAGGLSCDIARGQQRSIGSAKAGARLGDTGECLGQIQVLLQRQLYEPGQLRIAKTGPPGGQIRSGIRGPLLYRHLTLEPFRKPHIGLHIIRADGTARCQAGDHE